MKDLLNRPALLVIVALIAAFALVSWISDDNNGSSNDNQTTEENSQTEDQTGDEQAEAPANAYTYTAQAGDSYTKMARKSVQTYGTNNNVNLSSAEIIAAETFLTSDAGFPRLNLGQSVDLTNDAVKAAVEKAQALDAAAKARWERYVPYVNFDTSNVGQAQA